MFTEILLKRDLFILLFHLEKLFFSIRKTKFKHYTFYIVYNSQLLHLLFLLILFNFYVFSKFIYYIQFALFVKMRLLCKYLPFDLFSSYRNA